MAKGKYTAKPVDRLGNIDWTHSEQDRWQRLVTQQLAVLPGRACREYLHGLETLAIHADAIPCIPQLNQVLTEATGWAVKPVPALIDFDQFFYLLSQRQFPVATFIRSEADFNFLQEPDIFHEVFGHCPLLTHPAFANFTHAYGQLGYQANHAQRIYLARLYWFTVEFGIIHSSLGRRIYGGGILSSVQETLYALDSPLPEHVPFNLDSVLRTPYRIDHLQPKYFEINELDELFCITKLDLLAKIKQAQRKGLIKQH
ncbi:phenylalanine 4-monooxygenase [Saccharobesus litoralis]|uniref:Phenylalanine-4-hydroxylase n=1 Tax=Saccharobesus litoralis TaxID=2172099 RepID=A0A2S0VSJ9_9ALTE|nr:phenylalanine 4-monooxygenase [Saccharobesus litoralis]AWB67191.1 phenylalanine 4-monooxygenase [Saccharobesus litoralis]